MTDARLTHLLEQLSGELRDVADQLATYRARLIEGGVPEAEAWALVQRLEERLLGPLFDKEDE